MFAITELSWVIFGESYNFCWPLSIPKKNQPLAFDIKEVWKGGPVLKNPY